LQTDSNIANSSCFQLSFEEQNEEIQLQEVMPITDSEGKKLQPYTFTVTNTCSNLASYQVNLENILHEYKELPLEYVKVELDNNTPVILTNHKEVEKSLEEAKISYGDYSIFLSKSEPYVIRGWNKFDCDYFLIQLCAYDKNVLNLKYTTNYKERCIKSFRQVAVADRLSIGFLDIGFDCSNHFCYEESSGNIILGNKLKSPKWYIDGACFEEFNKSAFEGLFYDEFDASPLYQYPISELNNESFIVYKGYSFLEETSYTHLISITKTNEGIKINYTIKDRDMQSLQPIILDTGFVIPISNEGKITVDEINMLIAELQTRFPDDDFIAFIISELESFINRISIRDGVEEEVLSPINPKVLYGKPFSDVYEEISSNKDYYFSLLQELFEKETGKKPDSVLRALKPKD